MPPNPSTSEAYLSKTRVRAGLLTPHNSITEDLPAFMTSSKGANALSPKDKAKATTKDPSNEMLDKNSLRSVSITGEEEASKFEAELLSLDNRAAELEKELIAVREAALEMRQVFNGDWDDTMDESLDKDEIVARPLTPPAEHDASLSKGGATKELDYFAPLPPSTSDEPPVLVMEPDTYYVWFDLEVVHVFKSSASSIDILF